MLTTLYIKHYALIEELSINFEKGLNIITGETGAGKSILIDALGLLLGERASTEVIRTGCEKAIVEGTFAVKNYKTIEKIFQNNEIEFSDEVLIRREISIKGQNRCFVNDSPVALSLLKEIGNVLVDLHGQHEHQSLLRSETHIDFLDNFGTIEKELQQCSLSYGELGKLSARKKYLQEQEQQLKEKKSLYEFQIQEIDAINPQLNEEEELEKELTILENSEKLTELTTQTYQTLYEAENSITDALATVRKQLEILNGIDATFSTTLSEIHSAEVIIEEVAKFIQSYTSKIEFNPERLEEIRERLGNFTLLKKKYGGSVETIIEHRKKIGEEYSLAENFEQELSTIEKQLQEARKQCAKNAEVISEKRKTTAKKLQQSIISSLTELGINKAKFEISITQKEIENSSTEIFILDNNKKIQLTSNGMDVVEFFISTNIGEEVKPLAKVASGGEVSRIMLALKSALAHSDKTPLLIFDEIDTGVSGRIGQSIGLSLKRLSTSHQIIAITHLPQIAALADTHFAVEKNENEKRTVTTLRKLSANERLHEIAKLLSGAEVTDAGLKTAKELMEVRP